MNRRSIILIVTLFVLVVVGMFSYAYIKKAETTTEEPVVTVEEEEVMYPDINRITAKHYFIDGKHTFVGEVELPTPCDLLEVDSVVMESFPEQIQLNFNVINNAEACAQVITSQRFLVSAEASEEASVSATFMGRDIELNLVPASEGETPEEFELFIKG